MSVTRRKATVTATGWSGDAVVPVRLDIPDDSAVLGVYIDGEPVPYIAEGTAHLWVRAYVSGDVPTEMDIYTTKG